MPYSSLSRLMPSAYQVTIVPALEDIVLQYTYPRLDAEVSKHRNHLLKAPFCVHPKTGRVCVPVDPNRIDDFKPERVPTVSQLLRELDEVGASANGEGAEHHSGTSLLLPSIPSQFPYFVPLTLFPPLTDLVERYEE